MTDTLDGNGAQRRVEDTIRAWPAAALAATLENGSPVPGEDGALPPLRHWLHFLPIEPLSRAGADGHAATGGFLPDTGLPRRMWAGGRIAFHRPLRVGERAVRTSRVTGVREKAGRSGPLVFVTVVHEIAGPDGPALREEQDLVYRAAPQVGAAVPQGPEAPDDAAWREEIDTGPVLLFRYSALTFNSHRIHYDHPYVTGVEGYAAPVVHGPLMATLMADLACKQAPGRRLARFSFRGVAPALAGEPLTVAGRPEGADGAVLWTAQGGRLCMQGEAGFAAAEAGL
ncbi:MaoC family dehydratase N-terminal domain-containing protein [Aquibium sp. A9E412]|uniref:FAS1-like dehydratase domain-containing protein n=1 Tax=Aquibium sp. A9E412 TaxID=2976767 RepID=UPI0025B1EA58|nr:MaoC family dehydratase N-terminal domain-containing protein [Aquibium sp. A9E412]MDN2567378.1 MaoC family dehydratase N-terminal domain-containing protein [Aquibium sp. A9E412]